MAMNPDVGLGVAAVARRLGVAAGTLRTWDRRYGVGPTGHVAGSHRRYTAADLARLSLMRRLMLDGAAAADAARVALARDEAALAAEVLLPDPDAGRGPDRAWRSRTGGGRIIPLADAAPAARGLARAAMALDDSSCSVIVGASLQRRGVLAAWDEVFQPVLHGIGERRRSTGRGTEVEHLVSECIEDALRATTRRLTRPRNTRPVLVAGLETEEHRLPLHAVAAALAERQVAVRMLGPRLPVRALADAITRSGPGAVFLWANGAVPASTAAGLRQLPATRPAAVVVLGGPGWRSAVMPSHARWALDLTAAVSAVAVAVGVGAGPELDGRAAR